MEKPTEQSEVGTSDLLAPFSVRAERVLAKVFHGLHHCPKIHKDEMLNGFEMWEVNKYGEMATFDFDELTRLVIAAHDECIRAAVAPSGPGMVKIRLWPRYGREGRFSERHPTMEKAIETLRC